MRNGSYTSSTVSGCSPTLMATVDSPTGPPPNCSQTVTRMARSTLSSPSSSTPNVARPSRADGEVDRAVAPDLGEVADAPQQPVGDAGRAPGPTGDLGRAGYVDLHAEDAGGALHDGRQLAGRVVVEPRHEAEPIPQRPGDQPGAGGGPDEGEAGQREADGRGRRALAHDDVELEVLHGRVEDLLDRAGQAVDLVDEQHVAVVELGDDGREVAGPLEGRARGDVDPDAHLGRDDAGQAGLAEAGRPGQQEVVGGLAPPAGRLQDDREVLLQLGLADELLEAAGPQPGFLGLLAVGRAEARAAPHARWAPSVRSASRSRLDASPSGGQVAQHLAHLVGRRSRARPGPRGRRPARVGPSPLPVARAATASAAGTVEAGLQLEQEAGRRLATHAGHEAQRVEVARAHRGPQLLGRVDGEGGQRQGRPDAVGAEERLEAVPLVAAQEAVQRLGVLADVVADVEEGVVVGHQGGEGAGRDHHAVAHAADLDAAPRRRATARAPLPRSDPIIGPPPARRACNGAIARWVMASAAASAASAGLGRRAQPEADLHHALHLRLVGAAPAGDGGLHLVRGVLHDLAAERRGLGQGQAAGLPDAHGRAHVDLEEDLLHGHDVGLQLGDEARPARPGARPGAGAARRWARCGARRARPARSTPFGPASTQA